MYDIVTVSLDANAITTVTATEPIIRVRRGRAVALPPKRAKHHVFDEVALEMRRAIVAYWYGRAPGVTRAPVVCR